MQSRKWRLAALLSIALAIATASLPLRAQSPAQDSDEGDDEKVTPMLTVGVKLQANGAALISSYMLTQDHATANLKPVLESALHCALTDSAMRGTGYGYYGNCNLPAATSGLLRDYRIATSPLLAFAREQKLELLQVSVTLPEAEIRETTPGVKSFTSSGRMPSPSVSKYLASLRVFSWRTDAAIPESIGIRIGYDSATVQRRGMLLLAALLLPIFLAVWLRRRALSAQVADKSAVWFSYIRYQQWMLNGSLVAWWASCETVKVTPFTEFLLQNSAPQYRWLPSLASTLLTWLPPVIVWVLCVLISHPVQEKLRGLQWTRKDLVLQAVYSLSSALLPLLLAAKGIIAFASGSSRTAVLLFFAAFAVKLIARFQLQKLMGMQPQALTTGELRDTAFAMANRLGVKLQQIFVIPAGKGQMANAFARSGNTIAFTDYLLQRMSRREVDYILGHELSHLRLKHLQKLGWAYMASIGTGVFLFTSFRSFIPESPFVRYGLLFAISTLGPYFWSRRFEFAADAGAVEATGDAEAAISSLFKLASLNMHPLNWSKWGEKWLTHPSTLRRAEAIARKASIPLERLPEIAQRAVETDTHYTIPASAIAGNKILSTTKKTGNAIRALVAMLGAIILTPTAFALLVKYTHFSGSMQRLIYVAGFAAAFGAYLTVGNFVPVRKYRGLVGPLKAKLQSEGVQADAWNGVMVGLAPGPVPRLYEGQSHWDLGFLFFRADRICYWGEETHFALRRDQVISTKLGPSTPSLLRLHRVYIAWRDMERSTCGVLSLGCATPDTALKLDARTQDLFARLMQWHATSSASKPLPAPLDSLSAPEFGSVTGISPSTLAKRKKVVNLMFRFGLLAAGVAVVAGLPFHLLQTILQLQYLGTANSISVGAGWYVVGVTLGVLFLQYIPNFRYKEVPVLQADLGKPGQLHQSMMDDAKQTKREPETVKV